MFSFVRYWFSSVASSFQFPIYYSTHHNLPFLFLFTEAILLQIITSLIKTKLWNFTSILPRRLSIHLDTLISLAFDDSTQSHTSFPSHHSQTFFPDWLLFLCLLGAPSRRFTSWGSLLLFYLLLLGTHIYSHSFKISLLDGQLPNLASNTSLSSELCSQLLIKFVHEFSSCPSNLVCPNLDSVLIQQLFMLPFWHHHTVFYIVVIWNIVLQIANSLGQ